MACCMRVESPRMAKNGGYIWVLDGGDWRPPLAGFMAPPPPRPHARRLPPPPEKLTPQEVLALIERDSDRTSFFDGLEELVGPLTDSAVEAYNGLGVFSSVSFGGALGVPMRGADGQPCGIRYRDSRTGEKWSAKGSRDGLFFAPSIFRGRPETLFVVEGFTDALAVASLGLCVVGRSSCATGRELVRSVIRATRPETVVMVGDADKTHVRPNGSAYMPGRDGVTHLREAIGRDCKTIYPAGAKDIREYILSRRRKCLSPEWITRGIMGMVKDAVYR